MFDWFVWTPVTVFMAIKACVLIALAGYLGWREAGPPPKPKAPKPPRPIPREYTEAERL